MSISEEIIDDAVILHKGDLVNLALYILEQYCLEDGVKGQDAYQDALGRGWKELRLAVTLKEV